MPDRFAAIRGVGLSGQMHGAVLLGRDRDRAAPRDSVERRALARAVHCTGAKGAAAWNHRGRARDARLHRAEAALDRATRAGDLCAHRHGGTAQGLRAFPPHRGACHRCVRRRGNAVARRGRSHLVGGDPGGDWIICRADAASGGGLATVCRRHVPTSRANGGCRRMWLLREAGAMPQRALLVSARSPRATLSFRWAPRASTS